MAATFVVQIKAETTGVTSATGRLERDLDKVKNKALEVNRAMRQVFGIFAIRELATGLYGLVDGYTALQNKLAVVAKDQRNLNGLMGATFKVAQETRSSWEATSQMFSRMAMNSKQLGVSQKELIDFTKSLNQAIVVGGATSTEASAGLLQLSQGMASGALKGDELRAVLEQLPVVADVIAKKFNVTRGQLRALGTSGKIAGKDIIDAFKDSAKEIDEAFKKTTPTMSQGFEMIRNAAMKFFGEAGTGSGVLKSLAEILKFVAANFDTIGKVVLAAGQAFLGLMVIKTVIGLMRSLWIVVAANPLTAFVMAISTGILLLRQFGDQISTGIPVWTNVKGIFVSIGDVLRVLWSDFKKLIGIIGDFITDAWGGLTSAFSDGLPTDGIVSSLGDVLVFIAGFVGTAVGLIVQIKEKALPIFGGLVVSVGEMFIDIARKITELFENVINAIIDGVNKVSQYTIGGSKGALNMMSQFVTTGDIDAKKVQDATKGAPKFDHIDLSWDNPLAGSAKGTIDLVKEGLAETKKTATEFMSSMEKWKDSVLSRARDAAAKRHMDEKNGSVDGYVGTDPLSTIPPGGAGGKIKGDPWAAMLKRLEALLHKSNEVRDAQMKLADAEALLMSGAVDKNGEFHTVLEELEKRGISAGTVLSDLEEQLRKALDPFGTWVDETIAETAAMAGSTAEYERKKKILEVVNDLTEKGIVLTEAQRNEIERITKLQEERARIWKIEQEVLERATAPVQKYRDTLAALSSEQVRAKLTAAQLSAEFQRATAEFTASNDAAYEAWQKKWAKNNPFAAGWLDAREKIQEDMLGVSAAVSDVLTTAFGNLESFILDTVQTGKIAWDSLIEGIFESLDRLALKILETWLLTQLLPGGGGGGAVGIASAITGGGVGDNLIDPWDAGGYATGGSFTVPGVGGPDSQRVMMNLTPGENVTVTPPGHVSMMGGGSPGEFASAVASAVAAAIARSGSGKTSVHNHIDRGELLSAVDTPEGERVIINVLRKNPGALKGLLQK